MIDRKFIGLKAPLHTVEVEKGQLKFFALAVGEKNPIYTNEDAAKAAGYPNLPAPPTYPFSLNIMNPHSTRFLDDMGIDIGRILHGEQQFEYLGSICAGDTITVEGVVSEIYEKKGGALDFVVQEFTGTNQHDHVVVRMKSVTVVRN